MEGWPVWLASISRRNSLGRIIPTGRWTPEQRAEAEAHLDWLLEGVGDPSRQREFRMCITLCRHRAVTQAERDSLGAEWLAKPPKDIAGGPVEVLWYRGVPDVPSTRPCASPGREQIDLDLWLPVDCGRCESCLARAACMVRTA